VQGTAALQVDTARVEPVAGPRLRVAPPAPISAPRAPFVAVMIALVVAGVLGILVINTKTNENSFRISRLQENQAALDNQQQQLDNQIAGYKMPGNLDAAARRLGLVKADAPAYIRLPDGKIIGIPKPGEGQPAVTAQNSTTTGQNGSTQNGSTQNGSTQNGSTQNGSTQNGSGQNGSGQNSSGQNGSGTTQNGVTRSGMTQNGTTQSGTQNGITQNGTTQSGTQNGVTKGGITQNGTASNGLVPGAGTGTGQ
jgi:hypothetical protein